MSFSPPPTPPPPPHNAFNGLSMEERWARHLRNRQNMISGVGTSATVEQQNWHHEQLWGQSTTTRHPLSPALVWSQLRKLLAGQIPLGVMGFLSKYAREHEPSEYHGPEASPYRYSERRNRFEFIDSPSPSLDRSDSLSSVETVVFTDGASIYTIHAEDNRPVNSLGRWINNARGQSRDISFYELMKTVIRKAYALFITTTDAATQTTPSNSNGTYIISDPNVSIDGIQANINGRTSGTVLAVGEGVGESVGISTQAPSGHIRWSDIETTRSMTENPTAVRQGSNNNGKGNIPVACLALSVPNHLGTVNGHVSTPNVVVTEASSPPASLNDAVDTSPTRTPVHTRVSSPTGESATNPALGAYASSPNPVTNNQHRPPNGPSLGSAETLVNEASADRCGEAHTSSLHEEESSTGTDTSTLEQQPQSEGVTDNRVLPADWTHVFHEMTPFERELDLAMVPGLQPRPGPELPPAYQLEAPPEYQPGP
ncbi:uncharacterized protein F4817DRAFT_54121 [Daldinia loculata]|uniref:uncharacterized protein n=1 Tax=Daldinia loculata TaxID=103429 RepID=UPI0020C1E4A6|nr:uncharacterized protein F4817DRAFT_54121 [Daldinia loculata]KAI1648767.1 hypothetical protein F4817DRAFT_54121 [Daldinia loculata]